MWLCSLGYELTWYWTMQSNTPLQRAQAISEVTGTLGQWAPLEEEHPWKMGSRCRVARGPGVGSAGIGGGIWSWHWCRLWWWKSSGPVGIGSASGTGIGFRWQKSSGAVGIGFAGSMLVGWQLGLAAGLCGKRPLFRKRCPEQQDGHVEWVGWTRQLAVRSSGAGLGWSSSAGLGGRPSGAVGLDAKVGMGRQCWW